MFCTNEPEKLKKPLIKRCNVMNFSGLKVGLIESLLINISEFEGEKYNEEVISYVARESNGIPRDAIVWLKDIIDEGSWNLDTAKKLGGIVLDEDNPQIIELSKCLIRGKFKDSLKVYEGLEIPPETVRIAVAGYFNGCLKRSRSIDEAKKFSQALDILTIPIYVTGKTADHIMYNNLFKVSYIVKG